MDLPVDDPDFMRKAVVWCYRLILGREPENTQVVQELAAAFHGIEDMRLGFLGSEEFAASAGTPTLRKVQMPDTEVMRHFSAYRGASEPGFWHDFLGVRTRCKYLGEKYAGLSGMVEGPPGTEEYPLHEPGEWIGTLRSVLEAERRGTLIVVELGAGWAPWLVGATVAARQRGIVNVLLTGVEGSDARCAFMRQHFIDNGIDPDKHKLIHGVVGAKDGTARFPVSDSPQDGYGAEADFRPRRTAGEGGKFEKVRCLAIATLLADVPYVDLLHCDIQGAEFEVMQAGADAMNRCVRRTVIGTHGRDIEANLMALFGGAGWVLEDESVCALRLNVPGQPKLDSDGYQVWSNPALAP